MKKVSTAATEQNRNFSQQRLTIGLDLGDRRVPHVSRGSRHGYHRTLTPLALAFSALTPTSH
jgi:hypothetical protein